MLDQNIAIKIANLNKTYSQALIFNDLNLKIKAGEFVCVIGTNGSGKTTFLKCLAGLEEFNGSIIKNSNNLAYISQDPKEMIFPWLTVKSNIIFPLKKGQADKAWLNELLEITGLKKYENKYPYELSGGFVQLLLLTRAILNKADIILMDEPFKSLDIIITKKIQSLILKLWKQYRPTIILVSHSIEEAIFLATRIIIFPLNEKRQGKIIPINLPLEREASIAAESKFMNIKKKILDELNQ